ncbi:hypothetical protein DIPPA_02044 [Diplonema papillatum]|nr:hypothetical protein DIPPA_02044 [Diplonema papillatum]
MYRSALVRASRGGLLVAGGGVSGSLRAEGCSFSTRSQGGLLITSSGVSSGSLRTGACTFSTRSHGGLLTAGGKMSGSLRTGACAFSMRSLLITGSGMSGSLRTGISTRSHGRLLITGGGACTFSTRSHGGLLAAGGKMPGSLRTGACAFSMRSHGGLLITGGGVSGSLRTGACTLSTRSHGGPRALAPRPGCARQLRGGTAGADAVFAPPPKPAARAAAADAGPETGLVPGDAAGAAKHEDPPRETPGDDAPGTEAPPAEDFRLDRRVYSVAMSSLLTGMGIGVIIPVMPLFAQSIGISPAGLGLVISAMGFARLACNLPAAWAADKYGRKPLMVMGPALSSVGMLLCSVASSLEELLAMRTLSGAGGSFQMTGSQLYLADISRPENRARTMAPLAAAFSTGAATGPIVGGIIAAECGLAAPFLFVGAALLCASVNNYAMLTETLPKQPSPPPGAQPGSLASVAASVKATTTAWKPLFRSPSMRALLALHTAYWACSTGAMFMLLPLVAADSFGMGAAEIGQGFTVYALINVLGSQPAAWASDKYGRKAVVGPACLAMAASALLIPFATTWVELSGLWLLWGCGATCLGTTPTAYATDLHDSSIRSQALALLRSAGDVGLMLGAGTIGLIAKVAGITAGFWSVSFCIAFVGVNFMLHARETVGKYKQPDPDLKTPLNLVNAKKLDSE